MLQTDYVWRTRCHDEGYYTSEVRAPENLPVRTFLPFGYEPNYPYPLLVFLHGHASNEERVLRLAPRLSRRNYVAISLRGPRRISKPGLDRPAFTWPTDGEFGTLVEDYVINAVEQTRRTYHVHSERIYLVGVCEGASIAYRLGLTYPEKLGGIVALNGAMPLPGQGRPLFRLPEIRELRVMIGHGSANTIVPIATARRDYRALYAAGLDVQLETYPTTHRLHPDMLRDVDRWIQDRVAAELCVA